MLNLSFMFSGKPAPVVGGPKVLGYAMGNDWIEEAKRIEQGEAG